MISGYVYPVEQALLRQLPIFNHHPQGEVTVHHIKQWIGANGPQAQLECEFRDNGDITFKRIFIPEKQA